MRKKRFALILVMILAVAGVGCGASAEGRPSVVATGFVCYDFVRQVAGDSVDLTLLIKPGVEVHSYEPTPAEIRMIGEADLFVYIGGESDAWVENILAGFDASGAPGTLKLMDTVAPIEEEGEPDRGRDSAPEYDEHIWTSPQNAMLMVHAVGEALAGLKGMDAQAVRAAAQAYIGQIAEIDDAFTAAVAEGERREIVFADRFPFLYFARAYGLEYTAAFPSCTADTEPTPQTIMRLIQTVVRDRIPVVYTIEMSTQAVARAVAEETGAAIETMHSMQTVSQSEFDAGESYVSIMWKNVRALSEGLK